MKTSFSSLCMLVNAILGSAQTIDLKSAASFAALSVAGITNTGATVITGDLGTTGTSVTGFPPGVIVGKSHINDNISTIAEADAHAAFVYGQGLTATVDKAGRTTLGGENLPPGIYKYDINVGLEGSLTLNGGGSTEGVWIFQIASTLITSTSSNVELVAGAKACNVFWIIGSSATLGTYSSFAGNVLASASIAAETGVSIDGSLYAGASITFDTNAVNLQSCKNATTPATMKRSAKFRL